MLLMKNEINIFAYNVRNHPIKKTGDLLRWLNAQELARFERMKKRSDKKLFLCGRVLAKSVIGELLGIKPESVKISVDKSGRPFLKGRPAEFDFNLSHGGDWVVLMIGRGPVGVDVEKISPIETGVVSGFSVLSDEECEYLAEKDWREFYRVWTLKEAFFKTGGVRTLADARICFKKNKIADLKGRGGKKWNFSFFNLDKDHCLAACWAEIESNARIKHLFSPASIILGASRPRIDPAASL